MTISSYSPPTAADANNLALRPRDAARSLGVSERTLWSLTKRREIPFVRFGKAVRYPVHLLREWLDKQAQRAEVASDD